MERFMSGVAMGCERGATYTKQSRLYYISMTTIHTLTGIFCIAAYVSTGNPLKQAQ